MSSQELVWHLAAARQSVAGNALPFESSCYRDYCAHASNASQFATTNSLSCAPAGLFRFTMPYRSEIHANSLACDWHAPNRSR